MFLTAQAATTKNDKTSTKNKKTSTKIISSKDYKKKIDAKMKKITSALAKSGKFGKSFACCKGVRYDQCAKIRPNCFTTDERNEMVSQDEIKRFCTKDLQTAGKSIFKKITSKNDQKNTVEMALLNCLQKNKQKFSKPCLDGLKNRIKAIAKSKHRKSTNLSRDDIKN
jgi:hypothetical protein